jgi:hypothetical protein
MPSRKPWTEGEKERALALYTETPGMTIAKLTKVSLSLSLIQSLHNIDEFHSDFIRIALLKLCLRSFW